MSGLLLFYENSPGTCPRAELPDKKVTLHATTALSDCHYSALAPLHAVFAPLPLPALLTEDMKLHVSSSQCNALLRPLAAGSRNRNIIYTRAAREAPVESAINAM